MRRPYDDLNQREPNYGHHSLLVDGETERVIPSAPRYTATSHGRIVSYRRRQPVLLTPAPSSTGYWSVSISDGGRTKTFGVHILVCEAFNGVKPEWATCVRHLDDDKSNNRPGNLAYGTQADNIQDAIQNGRMPAGDRNGTRTKPESRPRGSQHTKAKVDEEIVRRIRSTSTGSSDGELARELGLHRETVRMIRLRKTWAHVA